MGILIKAGATPIPFEPANGRGVFELPELQAAVGGDIEVKPSRFALDGGEPLLIVLNEDGIREGLAFNAFATAIYHEAGGPPDDVIVGDVVLATFRELDGDDEVEAEDRAGG